MFLLTDVTCPLCGCLCDDLTVEVRGDQIIRTERACAIGQAVMVKLNTARPSACRQSGADCSYEDAIQAAGDLLLASRAPLVLGMGYTGTEGQRAAIALAEQLGAVIDSTGAKLAPATMLAMQQVGFSTCTLGEIKQRANLVIFWGADPEKTHPRHLERYSAHPRSEFLPGGRKDRTLITIHHQETLTERQADLSLKIPVGSDAVRIGWLRQLLRDENVSFPEEVDPAPWQALAKKMKACRYGTIFFGPGLLTGTTPHLTVESLFQLVTELNAFTRFTVRALGNPGGENVLAWQTGFPLAVDFQQQYPRYQPGEFSANSVLERGDADLCVIIGSESLSHLSKAALASLKSIPTILLDPPHLQSEFASTVQFTTSLPGVQSAGTMYRMDDVALPLRQLTTSPYPRPEQVLQDLLDHVLTDPARTEQALLE